MHNSFARIVTLHAISYLTVQWNVGFNALGHNIFLEDAMETYNVIEDNLVISARSAHCMLQTDITVAAYWITHPTNHVRRNRAAGSDFYGFWYELKEFPDGPSATDEVCPRGEKLGDFVDNLAHSNVRFGLRILELSARKYPCLPSKDLKKVNPYLDNPSY